jgi:hypothetical protein
LQDPKLIEIAKYLKKFSNGSSRNKWVAASGRSFADMLGREAIEWEKVKEEDWQEFDLTDEKQLKKAKTLVGSIFSTRENSKRGVYILTDGEGLKAPNLLYVGTYYTIFKLHSAQDDGPVNMNFSKQYQVRELLDDDKVKKLYYIDATPYLNAVRQKWNDRVEAKKGIVLNGDPSYNRKEAEKNVERYKKIIQQNKAAKGDDIVKRVEDIVNKAMEYATKAFTDPKMADSQSDVQYLMALIYSSNEDGWMDDQHLLPLFNSYIRDHKNIVRGNAAPDITNDKSQAKKKKKMEDLIKKAEGYIQNIESKLK